MPALTLFPRIMEDRRGGISIIGALSLTSVAGIAGLAMETSHGYAVKVDNQRVADAAALAAALALAPNVANTPVVQPTAEAIALANGVAIADVNAATTDGPTTGVKIVTVTIDTDVPLSLARVITDALSYNVRAVGVAQVTPGTAGTQSTTHPNAGACFLALDSAQATTYAITVSGSSTITGNANGGCDVQAVRGITVSGSANIDARNIQANGNIFLDGSASLDAVQVDAGGSITRPNWNSSAIETRPNANNIHSGRSTPISDPLATGSVQTALAKVSNTANYPIPNQPVAVPPQGTTNDTRDWSFTNNGSTGSDISSSWRSGNTWTIPRGTYNLRNVTIDGSTATLNFAAGSVVTISGTLSASGSTRIIVQSDPACVTSGVNCNIFNVGTLTVQGGGARSTFGHGTYRFGTANFNRDTAFENGEVRVTNTATFGPYTHTLGSGTHMFGRVIVGGSGNVTMGDGDYYVAQDMSVGGSASFRLGTGTKTIGANGIGQSVLVDGSTLTDFGPGNATLTGALEIGGSTTVRFGAGNVAIGSRRPAANTHCSSNVYDAACRAIMLTGSSNLFFGNGTFVTTGGIETGGSSSMTIGATANHYIRGNLVLNGAVTFGAGAYTVWGSFTKTASLSATGSNVSFFLSGPIELSGSASSTFTAPGTTSAGSEALADILFASLTTSPSQYTGSSQNTYTGVVYVPNSAFTISGSGRIVSGGCFALIAKTITVTGSGAGASRCAGVAAAGSTQGQPGTPPTVALIR